MLPIRPTYTTLPCSCEGTKKAIAKPSSQKFINRLMNMLRKFELSTSSGYRDLSGQSWSRFLGYRFIQERTILLKLRYNEWQVVIYLVLKFQSKTFTTFDAMSV